MPTITELIVSASVDPRGVRQGLNQALDYSKAFAREVEVVVGQTFKMGKGVGFEERGAQMVEGLLGGMQSELDSRKSQLREQLARGIISREQFSKEGQKAAAGFNQALLAGISHLEGRKLLSPGMREQMVAALREDGIKAGEAFAQGAQQGASRSTQSRGVGYPGRGPGLQVGGRNAAPAVVAAAFGFESLARSEMAAEAGARAAARAVSTFAAGFGVGGAVVSALIAGGVAMTEWWQQRDKEIEDARKKFKTEIDGMINDANASGLMQKMQQIDIGQRSAGVSKDAPGSFVGGLTDLLAQQKRDRAAITAALTKGNLAETNELVDVVQKRQKTIDLLTEQRNQLRDAILTPLPQQKTAGGMMAPMQIKAAAVKSPMEEMTDQVTRLTTAYGQLKALGQDTESLIGAQGRAEREVTAALKAENDQLGEKAVKLRALLVQLHAMTPDASALANTPLPDLQTMAMNRTKLAPAVGIGAKPQGAFADLQAQAEYVKLLEQQAAIMRAIGASGADAFEERANKARKAAIANLKALIEATDQLGGEEGERIRAGLLAVLGDMNVVVKESRDGFAELEDGIRGVLDAADGLGILNDGLRQTVSGALGIASALDKASKARAAAKAGGGSMGVLASLGGLGGTLGLIGAGIQVASGIMSLFKHSNEEVVAALRENSKRLADVHVSLMGGTHGLGAQATAGRTLSIFDKLQDESNSHGFMGMMPKVMNANLATALAQTGLTLDQFRKIIEDTGIKLFDENGKLIYSAVDQAQEYLQAVRLAASRLTDSLQDQSLIKDLHDRVFGKTSDADAIARELALLKQFAPELAKSFEGIDTSTKEGRDQLEKALQNLVAMIEAGTITPEMLGKFDNIKDLIDIILGVQGSLDGLGNAADKVTSALLNVPSGYKVAYQRYLATSPDSFDPSALDSNPWRKKFPGLDASGSGSADMMGTFSAGGGYAGGAAMTFTGDIYIDAQAESGEAIFSKVLKVAKRKAAVKFGDSTRWSEVQA